MKYYFIVNPQSGKIKKAHIENNIRNSCIQREILYEIIYTCSAGDARRIAEGISDQEECVVFSVGGDGSLNEVINGIAGSKNKILGNIPSGSGNDFAKTMKLYDTGIHSIDLGKINGRFFINVACIGMDADVANNLSRLRHKKWIPVRQRYNISLLYTYFHYKYKRLRIRMGETVVNSEYTILAVCNGQYYGGGYRIAPHALANDGMFDIYVVERMSKLRIIPLLLKLIRAKHETSSEVKRYKDTKIVVESDEPYTFNVDGELITAKKFELEIVKNAVRVFNDRKLIQEIIEK